MNIYKIAIYSALSLSILAVISVLVIGLFRKNINVDFVSRIYFNSISGLMNPEIYPPENYTLEKSLEK